MLGQQRKMIFSIDLPQVPKLPNNQFISAAVMHFNSVSINYIPVFLMYVANMCEFCLIGEQCVFRPRGAADVRLPREAEKLQESP